MNTKLFFKHFPPASTQEQIYDFFSGAGNIQEVQLFLDKESGQPKGSGLAVMATEADAQAVIDQLNQQEIDGKPITIEPYIEVDEIATQIASKLGEFDRVPRQQIASLVRARGVEFAQNLLQETLAIEEKGGMLLPDDSRRRTPGGVFFYLCRERLRGTPDFNKVFPQTKKKGNQDSHPRHVKQKAVLVQASEGHLEELIWTERLAAFQELLAEKGTATTVKMTLVGRPGKIKKMQDVTLLAMEHTIKNTALPKGVPPPPTTPTLYTVYIGAKQWRKVEDAIRNNPDDALILEGQGAFDPQIQGMALFVTNATTKLLQQAQKAAQQEGAPAQPPQQPAPAQPLDQEQAQALLESLRDQLADAQGKLQRKEGSALSLSQQVFKLEQEIVALKRQFDLL